MFEKRKKRDEAGIEYFSTVGRLIEARRDRASHAALRLHFVVPI
jgi:hypothetical protein